MVVLRHTHHRGQSAVLVLVLIAILSALAWWLFSVRRDSEREAEAFVREAATRIAFAHDQKFLDRHIAPERVPRYPPSFRERLIGKFRGFGHPTGEPEIEGELVFTSYFFQPSGHYEVRLQYPETRAQLYLAISRPRGWWQLDDLNVVWEPPPPPPAPPPADVLASPASTAAAPP